MKLALFSDVHANLPALEAVLADIDQQRPDAIYCLGDAGYVLLTINETVRSGLAETRTELGLSVEFRRITYDVNRAMMGVLTSELPDPYAAMLQDAR